MMSYRSSFLFVPPPQILLEKNYCWTQYKLTIYSYFLCFPFQVIILTCTNGYEKKCPHSSQWNFTSRSFECSDQNIYICLFDASESNGSKAVFTGKCGHLDLSREGTIQISAMLGTQNEYNFYITLTLVSNMLHLFCVLIILPIGLECINFVKLGPCIQEATCMSIVSIHRKNTTVCRSF